MAKPWKPPISDRQARVLADKKQLILLTGPRKASKTIGALHKLCYHAFTCPLGCISMCGRTLTDNYDGGAWTDLTKTVLPSWLNAPIGMDLVTAPRMDALTHRMFLEIKNCYGNPCRIQLDSLKIEDEVERIYKGKRFSMIYMTELSNFKSRHTFDIIYDCLRMIGLPPEEHLLLGDTNPSEDGEDSWIYRLWYTFRTKSDEEIISDIREANPNISDESVKNQFLALKTMQSKLSVHEFTIDDNIFLSDAEKAEQFARYCHNQDLLDRFYYGKWKKASADSLFTEVYRPRIHVIGDPPDVENGEILIPQENCFELYTGWDLGDTNNSWHCIERFYKKQKLPDGSLRDVSVFKVLDEYLGLREKIPLKEIIEEIIERMEEWQGMCNSNLRWTHVSDLSAFERYNKSTNLYEYQEVYNESSGLIELVRGPVKGKNSIQARINIVRKLLYYDRLYISSRCVQTQNMLSMLKKGKRSAVDRASQYKHTFDSLTYCLAHLCAEELQDEINARTSVDAEESGVVSI